MKISTIHNIKTALFLLLVGTMTGCSHDADPLEPSQTGQGMVPFDLVLPQGYKPISARAESHLELTDKLLNSLDEGSTLRLIVLNSPPDADGSFTKDQIYIPTIDANKEKLGFEYVVRQDENKKSYCKACQVDDEGNLIAGTESPESYTIPLATGNETSKTYYFMAISPAKKLEVDETDKNKIKVAVNNQEELLTNNNLWKQTMYTTCTVTDDPTQRTQVKLNPLMHSTAKIRIIIDNIDPKGGNTHVTDLEAAYPLVELDRVPTNPGEGWTGDITDGTPTGPSTPIYNLAIGSVIGEQMGNNILYNRMYIGEGTEEEKLEQQKDAEGNLLDKWVKEIKLTAETSILPMDARPTPMIISINVDVNHTPMFFQFQTNKQFKPGYVYTYRATIRLGENNIYIPTWQTSEWSWTLDPDPITP